MITTLLRISWTNLKRDRVAQALTFLLPILFFSIFASVFGNQGASSTARIRIAVVDEDGSELSRRIVEGLKGERALRVRTTADVDGKGALLDRAAAQKLVREGDLPVAVILPKGMRLVAAPFGGPQNAPRVQLLADVSDRIAPQMVLGLLQKVAWLPRQKESGGIDIVDVMRQGKSESVVSFYAAGVGVMFLLFSIAGASGSLLDEVDSGTLDRVLSTRVGMGGLLASKWLFLTLMGLTQLTIMFLWGRIAFGLDLFHHLPGFFLMTAVTASAAAGFGLLLATLARTRAQLGGVSTIVILVMSSLGGSMFPRFLMSETMQRFGLLTFNAWALDGYLKVFWRDAALWQLWPQVLVLALLAATFMTLARTFARRWEAA